MSNCEFINNIGTNGGAPSKLVGYFARVFTKGFKYDYDDCKSVSMNKF